MDKKYNAVGWFEIPATNLDRATQFYKAVFDIEMTYEKVGPHEMVFFPMHNDGIGASGALVKHESFVPSKKGVLVYFTALSGDLVNELGRVESAGGKILEPASLIDERYGYMATFEDTEGNRVAIHSRMSSLSATKHK